MMCRRASSRIRGLLFLPGISTTLLSAQPAPTGPEFQVNTYTTLWQKDPSVAMDDAGNFVVVWSSLVSMSFGF